MEEEITTNNQESIFTKTEEIIVHSPHVNHETIANDVAKYKNGDTSISFKEFVGGFEISIEELETEIPKEIWNGDYTDEETNEVVEVRSTWKDAMVSKISNDGTKAFVYFTNINNHGKKSTEDFIKLYDIFGDSKMVTLSEKNTLLSSDNYKYLGDDI